MTDQTRESFENYLDGSVTDTHGRYIGDAFDLWQAATLAEREGCAKYEDADCIAFDTICIKQLPNNGHIVISYTLAGKSVLETSFARCIDFRRGDALNITGINGVVNVSITE